MFFLFPLPKFPSHTPCTFPERSTWESLTFLHGTIQEIDLFNVQRRYQQLMRGSEPGILMPVHSSILKPRSGLRIAQICGLLGLVLVGSRFPACGQSDWGCWMNSAKCRWQTTRKWRLAQSQNKTNSWHPYGKYICNYTRTTYTYGYG